MRRASGAALRTADGPRPPWSDLILLATCNRVEIYTLTNTPRLAAETIRRMIVSEDKGTLYVLQDADAAAHLLRVASGLDSIAEGEQQVMEQVRKAPSQRPSRTSGGSPLTDLFLRAARIAPRIRKIAGVRPEDASVSHVAVRFVEAAVPLKNPIVALIGTGKMARIAAKGLHRRARIQILNRSLTRARQLARTLNGKAVPLADLGEVLSEADVVLAATAVQRPLVTTRTLRASLARRGSRPLWLIDLGFPRNVALGCRSLAGVHVQDLDGLASWGPSRLQPAAHARVEARIQEDAERMIESLTSSASLDIAVLRKNAEAVRRQEVAGALARLPDLSEEDRAVVDKLATRLVNRILHAPTQRLRSLPEPTRREIVQEIVSGLQAGTG